MDDVGWLALALFILILFIIVLATVGKKALSLLDPTYFQSSTEQEKPVSGSWYGYARDQHK